MPGIFVGLSERNGVVTVDGRKRQVLRAVVDDYVATAEPVASKAVVGRVSPRVSSATVRSEMQELEAEGYLVQPHVSAGRVPLDKGYRYYVDRLVSPVALPEVKIEALRDLMTRRDGGLAWVLRETAQLLAEATSYAGLAVVPWPGLPAIVSLKAVSIAGSLAVLLLVTDREYVAHRTVELPKDLPFSWVQETLDAISCRLRGVSLDELTGELSRKILEPFVPFRSVGDAVMALIEEGLSPSEERVFTQGTIRMFGLPEFRDVDRVRSVLEFLDSEQAVRTALADEREGVHVRIGCEHGLSDLSALALATATVHMRGTEPIQMAVLGPSRMDYGRVVGALETLVQLFEEGLAS